MLMNKGRVAMKLQNLKKSLFFSVLMCVVGFSAQSQMLDLMGSMAVGGAQSVKSVQSVGLMNKKLRNTQFLSQLQMKVADITMTYFGHYQSMSVQSMTFQNIKVVFKPVNNGDNFKASIFPVSQVLCRDLLNARFDNLVGFRSVDDGSFRDYTPQQARADDALCITSDTLSLIFQ